MSDKCTGHWTPESFLSYGLRGDRSDMEKLADAIDSTMRDTVEELTDLLTLAQTQQESLVTTLKIIHKISRDPAVTEICEAELQGR